MAIDNSRIKVTELDFDAIKENLKEYLRGQSEFSDYDFEGSGLSILLDVLAYNTHYNSLYTNLAINEMFLDSASKRNSVVSLAKNLGYVPVSATSPIATVNVTVTNPTGLPATLSLPRLSAFTASVDGQQYTFYNLSAVTITQSAGAYVFPNVELYEGTLLTFKYQVTDGARFIIPNAGVDLRTLTVRVQENASSAVFETYNLGDDLTVVDADTTAYFLKEIENELYEVYFGDNVIGKKPANGNVVTLEYLITSRDAANGARFFSFEGTIGGGTVSVIATTPAAGGADIESIDSIKYRAPRSFAAQNRAVTAEDYRILLPRLYPNIQSISVWGGEDNDPPVYGKVFISIKPNTGETLTAATKEIIKNDILSGKNVVSIIPEIVDPEYLYIRVNTAVYYNPQITTKTAATLESLVRTTINNYNENELLKFGGLFRYSKLSRLIDQTDTSITSNITTVTLEKEIIPAFNQLRRYQVHIDNPIYFSGAAEESVLSSGFTIPNSDFVYYIDDNGQGTLRLFYYVTGTTKSIVNTNVGTVDYTRGVITIDGIEITSAPDNTIVLYIKPQSNDVVSVRNQIVYVRPQDTTVTAVVDKVASGETSSGAGYTFTSSRT